MFQKPNAFHSMDWVALGKFFLALAVFLLIKMGRKSQVALQYAYKVKEENPETSIF
jgi:hypothetical protein